MSTLEIIGIIAGILAFSSYFFYIPAILRGETKPNRASWWIWGTVGTLIVLSYYTSGARETIWVPLSEAIGPALIALLSIRYGEGGWTLMDRWCLVGAAVGTFFWWLTDSPTLGLVFYLLTDFMAVLPTIRKSIHRPENEDKKAWALVFWAQLLNLFAVERWVFSILIYPVYMILTNGAIYALQFRKRGSAAFSSIDIVGQCLSDIPRTGTFQKAIQSIVKPGDVVLDSGTGSGILALFAAESGAKKVISLEYDPFVAEAAQQVIRANDKEKIVEVRIGDSRKYEFEPELKFDAVIMEMLTTGMIDENQVKAINNLHKQGAVGSHTRLIPFRHDTFITIGNFNFNCYGFRVPFMRHLWKFHDPKMREFTGLAKKSLLNSVDFSKTYSNIFKTILEIPVEEDGLVNSVYLSSVSHLTSELSLGDTDSLNGPVVVPISERTVTRGERLKLEVEYEFGGGYENFRAKITN